MMTTGVGSICLVTHDLAYVVRSGGIGTYTWLLAHLLAAEGWRVHLLYCGRAEDAVALAQMPGRLARAGIGFSNLDAFPPPNGLRLPTRVAEHAHIARGDHARHALETLHRERHFDLIEFADWEAVGFRTINAKRAGLAFGDVSIVVKLHSSIPWVRDSGLRWLDKASALQVEFCDRYAFEQADLQISPSRYMLEYACQAGWQVGTAAQVVPNPFPRPLSPRPPRADSDISEVVFFGRLESLKGLEIFVEAAKQLDPRIRLTFLGKDTTLRTGQLASEYVQAELENREVRVLKTFNREQALAYLMASHRVAVMPSVIDNFPYSVVECAVNGIPFLTTSVGGITEIVSPPELQGRLLFEPTARDLTRCLKSYLDAAPAERHALSDAAGAGTDIESNHRRVAEFYALALQAHRARSSAMSGTEAEAPIVSVCVTFYNLGAYLPDALASLAEQTYANLEVLVVDDGSTDPASIRVVEEQQALHPRFRFLRQAHTGPSAARNRGIAEATGTYFIPLDADNIAVPRMVERFVRAIHPRPDISALSCYYRAFEETSEIGRGEFRAAYRPVGGAYVAGSLENVYGDKTAIYRLADFRSVGGYETDRDSACEDWEAFVKLLNAGYRVDVVPEYLFYCRDRADSFSRMTDRHRDRRRVLRQYFGAERLPPVERIAVWTALARFYQRLEPNRADAQDPVILRYRLVDELNASLERHPALYRSLRRLAMSSWRIWQRASAGRRHQLRHQDALARGVRGGPRRR